MVRVSRCLLLVWCCLMGFAILHAQTVRLETVTVPLFYPMKKIDGPLHAPFAFLPDGGAVIMYRAEKQTMMEWYGPNFKSRAIQKFPENTFPEQLHVLADGSVAACVSLVHAQDQYRGWNLDTELLLYHFEAQTGRELFKVSLVGGAGTGPGAYWFYYADWLNSCRITSNGDTIAVYFSVFHNFSQTDKADTHQGDMFVVVDKKGQVQSKPRYVWSASHSFWMSVLALPNKDYLTTTTGDNFPWGVLFYNRSKDIRNIFWPPFDETRRKQLALETKEETTVDAGRITELLSDGSFLYAAGQSARDYNMSANEGDPILFKLSLDGNVLKHSYLAATPKMDYITMARLVGNKLLVLWAYDKNQDLTYAWYDTELRPLSTPLALGGGRAGYEARISHLDANTSAWLSLDEKKLKEVTISLIHFE